MTQPLRLCGSPVALVCLLFLASEGHAYQDRLAAEFVGTGSDASSVTPSRARGGSLDESLPDVQHGRDLVAGREAGPTVNEEDDNEKDEEPGGLLGKRLHGRGPIRAEYIYTGEVFSNMRGGITTRNAAQYFGLLDLAIHVNLDELGLFPGGKFFVLGENGHGRGLTPDYVGDYQWLSNIETSHSFTQVSEYWWERSFVDECVTCRLGKQDCNAEFAVLDVAGDFIGSSYGAHPTIPMPSYPDASMAGVVLLKLTDRCLFQGGVWDGAPNGRNWGLSNNGSIFSIYEFKLKWDLKPGMPGDCHAGMWYHNDQFDDITPLVEATSLLAFRTRQDKHPAAVTDMVGIAAAGNTYEGNHGFYCGVEQMIWKEHRANKEDSQGLGIFTQYGWAPPDRNPANHYVGAGLVFKGLIPRRNDDTCGLGLAKVIFSDRLPNTGSETAIEIFYKLRLGKFVFLQPDLQYIAQPSGIYRDAFVAGLRLQTAL